MAGNFAYQNRGCGMKLFLRCTTYFVACAILLSAKTTSAAESTELRIARQPGLVYLQIVLMEQNKLIEKHAAALGLEGVKVTHNVITSGGVITEALISNSIDMATTGVSNMLLLWGRNGSVKSIAGVAGMPQVLVTRNSNVKNL